MKSVFFGPRDCGQSTLVNRILGVEISPALTNGDFNTRTVLTFRNVEGSPFCLTAHCITLDAAPTVLRDLKEARRLHYECEPFVEPVSNDTLRVWLATSPSPWLSYYEEVVDAATLAMEAEYASSEDVYRAILELSIYEAKGLFIDSIEIEGHFPNLGPGGALVDLPCFGISEWMDSRIVTELASATHLFCVLDYTRGTTTTNRVECQAVNNTLPPSMPLNVCFTHARCVFTKAPLEGECAKRACVAIHIDDLDDCALVTAAFAGRETKMRFFDSDDDKVTDAAVLAELIEFMKSEAEKLSDKL